MQAELRFRIDLNSVFPNLFKFTAPFDGSKKISDTPSYYEKRSQVQYLAAPLELFRALEGAVTSRLRTTAWMRKKFAKIKKRI